MVEAFASFPRVETGVVLLRGQMRKLLLEVFSFFFFFRSAARGLLRKGVVRFHTRNHENHGNHEMNI